MFSDPLPKLVFFPILFTILAQHTNHGCTIMSYAHWSFKIENFSLLLTNRSFLFKLFSLLLYCLSLLIRRSVFSNSFFSLSKNYVQISYNSIFAFVTRNFRVSCEAHACDGIPKFWWFWYLNSDLNFLWIYFCRFFYVVAIFTNLCNSSFQSAYF